MTGYTSFEDYLKDYEIFNRQADDRTFTLKMIEKVNSTEVTLKRQILIFIDTTVLEKHPLEYFEKLMSNVSNKCFLVIKSEEDPWYEA